MIKVLKSGFYTTIQDSGRYGFQEFGVPISGAMDHYAFTLANSILGNTENDAVLEITMVGPILEFAVDSVICITGANISPALNDKPLKQNCLVMVKAKDVLAFGKLQYGVRAYLAVGGGFKSDIVMHSRSQYKNVTQHEAISKNDELIIDRDYRSIFRNTASVGINKNHFTSNIIEVDKGPEFDKLSKEQQKLLFIKDFTISKSHNRMAYQLFETIENSLQPIITSLVIPGTIQLTPSGKLIVLMQDCQTTGGYPRILQLAQNSINILSQKNTMNNVKFRLTV